MHIPWWMQLIFIWLAKTPTFAIYLVLVAIDIVVGILLSTAKGTLSSSVSWGGMVKKLITLLILLTTYVVGGLIPQVPSFEIACTAFIITEVISILEGAALAGVPLPPVLQDALIKLKTSRNEAAALKSGGISQPLVTQINVIPGRADDPNQSTTSTTTTTTRSTPIR